LHYGDWGSFVALSAASYLWDCTDGHLARTYGLTSDFGDVYDHAVDVITFVLLLFAFGARYAALLGWTWSWAVIALLWLLPLHLMCAYLGSQQAIVVARHAQQTSPRCTVQPHGGSMDLLRRVWAYGPEHMPWLRYFSCATFRVCTFALVLGFEAVRAGLPAHCKQPGEGLAALNCL